MKGFLARRRDGTLRITKGQVELVRRAHDEILHRAVQGGTMRADVAPVVRRLIGEACDTYSVDRSCVTCDFERDGFCHQWQDQIPPHAVDEGCDRHQTHGAPF